MRVERFTNASRFCEIALPMLMRQECENNLIIGKALSLRDEAPHPEHVLAIVFDSNEPVVACMRTPPWSLIVTRSSKAPLDTLAHFLHDKQTEIPEAVGPTDSVHHFSNTLAALRGQRVCQKVALRIMQTERVIPPARTSGTMRVATGEDVDLLDRWMHAFSNEIGEHHNDAERANVIRRIRLGQYLLWEDPAPVSVAGWTGRTPSGVRINAVYTPPEFRGKGYASNCVATITQMQLEGDRKFCFLFTDAKNPTSNKIYQRMGYEWVCDYAHLELS